MNLPTYLPKDRISYVDGPIWQSNFINYTIEFDENHKKFPLYDLQYASNQFHFRNKELIPVTNLDKILD